MSQKYSFIYIRQPKASSSSILATIQKVFCEGRACLPHEFSLVQDGIVPDAIWGEYFVFTAVRNPLARMVSTYNMFRRALRFPQRTSPPPLARARAFNAHSVRPSTRNSRPRTSVPSQPPTPRRRYMRRRVPGNDTAPGEYCLTQECDFSTFARGVVSLRTICETKQCCAFVPEDGNQWLVNLPNPHISQQAEVRGGRVERIRTDAQVASPTMRSNPFNPSGARDLHA